MATDEGIELERAPYWHWFQFALGYGLLAMLCAVGMNDHVFLSICLVAVLTSTLMLAAIWSVLGAGSYSVRLLSSHAIGSIVLLGVFTGYFWGYLSGWEQFKQNASLIYFGLAILFVGSLACQIPWLLLRVGLGWQFVYRNHDRQPSFRLADFFTLTFFCAVALGLLQSSINAESERRVRDQIVWQPAAIEQVDPNFESALQTHTVDAQREVQRQSRASVQQVMRSIALILLTVSTFSIPVVWLVFRFHKEGSGCGLAAAYTFCIAGFLFLIAGSPVGGQLVDNELLIYLAMMVGGYMVALTIPLAISRTLGFELKSARVAKRSTE